MLPAHEFQRSKLDLSSNSSIEQSDVAPSDSPFLGVGGTDTAPADVVQLHDLFASCGFQERCLLDRVFVRFPHHATIFSIMIAPFSVQNQCDQSEREPQRLGCCFFFFSSSLACSAAAAAHRSFFLRTFFLSRSPLLPFAALARQRGARGLDAGSDDSFSPSFCRQHSLSD